MISGPFRPSTNPENDVKQLQHVKSRIQGPEFCGKYNSVGTRVNTHSTAQL